MNVKGYLEKLIVIERILAEIDTSKLTMNDVSKLTYARGYLRAAKKLKEFIE